MKILLRQLLLISSSILSAQIIIGAAMLDGAVVADFLQTLKKFLENPVTMLI
jgi:pyruvate/2-oxoglutarate dehydrogenase complex dihydrolipoamide acyltransferase (E2) component